MKQIAVLQARLRSVDENVATARRDALLEGHTKSLAEIAAARKKTARMSAEAKSLRERCARQVGRCSGLYDWTSMHFIVLYTTHAQKVS